MLTSSGRVFTAACASYMFPEKGQLGVPEMSWETKPKPYDRALEVKDLSQFRITQIAAGNYHNVAADKNGNVFTWGDNSKGQLGVEFTNEFEAVPVKVPAKSFYADDTVAKLQKIYAGGSNSYFTMEASIPNTDYRKPATKSYDLFVCGHGLHGTLGTGTWVHAQYLPQKVRAISGLTECKLKGVLISNFVQTLTSSCRQRQTQADCADRLFIYHHWRRSCSSDHVNRVERTGKRQRQRDRYQFWKRYHVLWQQ